MQRGHAQQAAAARAMSQAWQLTPLCAWWFEECHPNLSTHARKLLALLGGAGADGPDQTGNENSGVVNQIF